MTSDRIGSRERGALRYPDLARRSDDGARWQRFGRSGVLPTKCKKNGFTCIEDYSKKRFEHDLPPVDLVDEL